MTLEQTHCLESLIRDYKHGGRFMRKGWTHGSWRKTMACSVFSGACVRVCLCLCVCVCVWILNPSFPERISPSSFELSLSSGVFSVVAVSNTYRGWCVGMAYFSPNLCLDSRFQKAANTLMEQCNTEQIRLASFYPLTNASIHSQIAHLSWKPVYCFFLNWKWQRSTAGDSVLSQNGWDVFMWI